MKSGDLAHWQGQLAADWGIDTPLELLGGEYDHNFRLDNGAGILKVMRAGYEPELVAMQVACLDHLAGSGLRLPRVLPAANGDSHAIHNDINDYNILCEFDGTGAQHLMTGLIDLGDMIRGPVVCDLAIAGAYLVFDQTRPVEALARIVAGYHAVRPVSEVELSLVWPLVLTRLAVSALNARLMVQEKPDDPYVMISQAPIERFFAAAAPPVRSPRNGETAPRRRHGAGSRPRRPLDRRYRRIVRPDFRRQSRRRPRHRPERCRRRRAVRPACPRHGRDRQGRRAACAGWRCGAWPLCRAAPEENGGWTPHIHFQLGLFEAPGSAWPGVAHPDEIEDWSALCPDPAPLLGLPPSHVTVPELDKADELARRRARSSANLSLTYADPIVVVRGWRSRLFDDRGRPHLDAYNNVPHVGHAHPRITAAAARQMRLVNTNTRYLCSRSTRSMPKRCARACRKGWTSASSSIRRARRTSLPCALPAPIPGQGT